MIRSFLFPLALVATAVFASACSSGPDTGAVRGEVYVALETGEEVSLAGRPVHLLPEAASVDSALARLCLQRQRGLGAVAAGDTAGRRAVLDRAWGERERLLASRSLRRAATVGPTAVFAFDSLAAGEYRLWADAVVQGERWTWLHPVRVRGGDTLRVKLDNATADDDPFGCQHLPRDERP